MSFANQSTDAENAKTRAGSTAVDDAVKPVLSKSAQKIAQDRTNQNTAYGGSGGKNPGANVQAGK